MKNIVKQIIFGIVLCLPLHLFCWGSKSEFEEESTCRFKNMGGTLPNDICYIRKFLERVKSMPKLGKDTKSDVNTREETGRAYMFYGSSGTGKTTAAKLVAEEADVLLDFHSEQEITQEIRKTKDPNGVFIKIYRDAKAKSEREGKPIIVVIDDIKNIFKKNPETEERICGVLRGEIDELKNKPQILTIITTSSVAGFEEPLYRRCMKVEWLNPSRKNRSEILKFYDSSISDDQAKLFTFMTRNFSGGDLEKFIKNFKEYKEKQSAFPFGQSYLKTIVTSSNLLKDYSIDTIRLAIYSAAAILMFVHRDRIAKVVLDKWKQLFPKQKEKEKHNN